MIDLATEPLIRLDDAAKRIPPSRSAKGTHISTILRWITRGVRAPSGQLVTLEALRVGGKWLTSAAALQRFAERLTPALGQTPAPSPRSPKARQRASERAARVLEKEAGI